MTWSKNGEVINFPPSQAASGGLYTTSSQLTLPAAQCPASESVTCRVEHYTNPRQDVAVPCIGQRAGWGVGRGHPSLP